jgi:hypothetical protein
MSHSTRQLVNRDVRQVLSRLTLNIGSSFAVSYIFTGYMGEASTFSLYDGEV